MHPRTSLRRDRGRQRVFLPGAPGLVSVLAVFLIAAVPLPASAQTTRHFPSEYPTIQAAINAADNLDSILIAPGTYSGEGNAGLLVGQKTLYIRGEGGGGQVTIDAGDEMIGITISDYPDHTPIIQDLRILHGNPYGVYVYNASPRFQNCQIQDCRTGMLLAGYQGVVDNVIVRGCQATGMAISFNSACDIQHVSVEDCNGEYGAGVQAISSSVHMLDVFIGGNDATFDGGGLYCESGVMSLSYLMVTGNRAAGGGGGICLVNTTGTATHLTVSRNVAGSTGGGISCAGSSSPVIDHSIVWGNCSPSAGREILVGEGSTVELDCCDVDASGLGGPGTLLDDLTPVAADPLFCNMGACEDAPTFGGVFNLATGSPCDGGACGLVGTLGVDCGATRIAQVSWGRIKALFR